MRSKRAMLCILVCVLVVGILAFSQAAQVPGPTVVGKVVDTQGLVSLRPVNGDRWTPVTESILLSPGDWLRTDVRGANATKVRLVNGGSLIVGPGSLVEFADSATLRVTQGELEITGTDKNPIKVGLPGQKADETLSPVSCSAVTILRIKDGKIDKIDYEPMWLKGFKGSVVKESMGELLVNIDGRDVPLTVGYHKVTVDIRDQIARTVIEESFVNHTNGTLEGIFHFPLPADASISNFGMWIGDELVQADVVEKQRAREIYETILRERRDPGLLEWAGGNIFKARVFPIFPHSEKRVTITYTQVLPMRNGTYKYSYPLESEMLRQNPLRELQLAANIYSDAPLKSVRCVSHEARIRQTANSANVEFSAQEYTPTKDLELVIEPDLAKQPLTVVPHQRGTDGYFLMLLNPPTDQAPRPLVGDGDPLQLIILADTSGSINADQRKTQSEFIQALLSSLGKNDKFMLAACDVDCNWLTDGFRTPDETEITKAMNALSCRRSLGWTDLDKVFAAVTAKAEGKCQIIYVGDGIQATSEIDPANFAKRIEDIFKNAVAKGVSCHAVATGSSYEAVVMKTIAAQGGGSFRRIEGDGGPSKAARELLEELTRPPVCNVKIEFKGLQAAAVYPEELPNLSAGSQQIFVGRYLPSSLDKNATIYVSGNVGNKVITFKQPLHVPEGEEGNSFIPRLWARLHLDKLLSQKMTPEVRDEIVSFSQEYRIMTPYTSFLVLESDEDRERFGVKRHFEMRDGEKFFADGRDKANYQLVQQQVKRAAAWRAGLRKSILKEMSNLGRQEINVYNDVAAMSAAVYDSSYTNSTNQQNNFSLGNVFKCQGVDFPGSCSSGFVRDGGWEMKMEEDLLSLQRNLRIALGEEDSDPGKGSFSLDVISKDADPEPSALDKDLMGGPSGNKAKEQSIRKSDKEFEMEILPEPSLSPSRNIRGSREGRSFIRVNTRINERNFLKPFSSSNRNLPSSAGNISDWFYRIFMPGSSDLFPPSLTEQTQSEKKPELWSEDAFKLASSLDRLPSLKNSKATVKVMSTTNNFDPEQDGQLESISTTLAMTDTNRWMTLSVSDKSTSSITWFTPEKYGTISLPYRIGLITKPEKDMNTNCPLPLNDFSTKSLIYRYMAHYQARSEIKSKGQAELILEYAENTKHSTHILIDTDRNVIIRIWEVSEGKIASQIEFDQFQELAGSWWATRVTSLNFDGKITSKTDLKVNVLNSDEAAKIWGTVEKAKADSILISVPLPDITEAKKASANGNPTAEQLLSLVSHFATTQQWDKAGSYFDQLRKQIGSKTGFRYIDLEFLAASRRNEETRKKIIEAAHDLVNNGLEIDQYLDIIPGDRIPEKCGELDIANNFLYKVCFQANEELELLDILKPVYERQPEQLNAMETWLRNRVEYLRRAEQKDTALTLEDDLLLKHSPKNVNTLTGFAEKLAETGEYERAMALLENALKSPNKHWLKCDLSEIYNTLFDIFEDAGLSDLQIQLLTKIVKDEDKMLDPQLCQRFLWVLLYDNRESEADKTASDWIKPVLEGAKLTSLEMSKATAAVNYVLGESYNNSGFYSRSKWFDEKWIDTIDKLVRISASKKETIQIANKIMEDDQFERTDTCRNLRAEFAKFLTGDISKTDFILIKSYVNWTRWNDPLVEKNTRRIVAGNLEKRWEKELAAYNTRGKDTDSLIADQIDKWGNLTASLNWHNEIAEQIRFYRRQFDEGPEIYRDNYAEMLFETFLHLPWNQKYEDEAFGMLGRLAAKTEPETRILTQADFLMSLVDWMVEGRKKAIAAAYTSTGDQNLSQGDLAKSIELTPEIKTRLASVPAKPLYELTRSERNRLVIISLQLSEEAVAQKLMGQRDNQPEQLHPWIKLEWLDILTRLAMYEKDKVRRTSSLQSLAAEAVGLLGVRPPEKFDTSADLLLFDRRLALAEYLVVRATLEAGSNKEKTANTAILPSFINYCRAGADSSDRDQQMFWRGQIYRILIALDRPAELETVLRNWIKTDESFSPWRVPLAYLLADTDRLKEAVTMLEAVEADDELLPAEYKLLATWYMALDEKDKYRKAKLRFLETMGENYLKKRVEAEKWRKEYNRAIGYDDGEIPGNINSDSELVEDLVLLMQKSEHPAYYTDIIQSIYKRTRDFRLLRCMAQGMIGHTAQQIYPLLEDFREILKEIRDEATVDEIMAGICEVRKQALTPVDRRALFLLEAEVKRRASEVLNQPGQHFDAALVAFKAAFKESWSPGEPRLMVEYLAKLGLITQEYLAQEQLNELDAMYKLPGESAIDRLEIAYSYSQILEKYEQSEKAIDVLATALEEYRLANGGTLNKNANPAIGSLMTLWENDKDFIRAEKWLRTEIERPANNSQREWLIEQLLDLYKWAFEHKVETTLGKGKKLYHAINREIMTELGKPGPAKHLSNLVDSYCSFADIAKKYEIKDVASNIRSFASEIIPDVLRRLSRNQNLDSYQHTVGIVAETLYDLASSREGLEFLLDWGEKEPARFRFGSNTFWEKHSGKLAGWRAKVKDLGDLEPRLLAIVLRELRKDLEYQESQNRNIYGLHDNYFWKEKAGEFSKVAEEVYAKRKDSGAAVSYIAEYLFEYLELKDRAIEIMLDAWNRNILDEHDQFRLFDRLHKCKRYKESLPVAERLILLRPDNPRYRCRLIISYALTNQLDMADKARQEAEEHFKRHGLWDERSIPELARGCLEAGLFKCAVAYYNELIAMHRRNVKTSPSGDPTLSGYYANLAKAYSKLGNTSEAVEAASGAVISWGQSISSRRNSVGTLVEVLSEAKDLDNYVATFEKQVVETKLDNPITRKALGKVYAKRGEHEKAVIQFRLAILGQPNDVETRQALVASLDALNKPGNALDQLLDLGELLPRDVNIRQQVYERLNEMNRLDEAERAATSIIEAAPMEAESHQAMAELRQEQNRWAEAGMHWCRVCELRELEPTGLLGLAEAQIHLKQFDEAKTTLDKILAKKWPERFRGADRDAQELLRQIKK